MASEQLFLFYSSLLQRNLCPIIWPLLLFQLIALKLLPNIQEFPYPLLFQEGLLGIRTLPSPFLSPPHLLWDFHEKERMATNRSGMVEVTKYIIVLPPTFLLFTQSFIPDNPDDSPEPYFQALSQFCCFFILWLSYISAFSTVAQFINSLIFF